MSNELTTPDPNAGGQLLPNTSLASGSDRALIQIPDPLVTVYPNNSFPWAIGELASPSRPLDRRTLTHSENLLVLTMRDEVEVALSAPGAYGGQSRFSYLLSVQLVIQIEAYPERKKLIEREISKLYQLRGWEGAEFSGAGPTLAINITTHYRSRRGL